MDWLMRFLLSAMAKRRRLMLNDILLLALRCGTFVVFALTRPNWRTTTAATEQFNAMGDGGNYLN